MQAFVTRLMEKAFSTQMIMDHTKTSGELKSLAPADAKAAIPTVLDSSSQSKLDKLKNAKPDDFSSDFRFNAGERT